MQQQYESSPKLENQIAELATSVGRRQRTFLLVLGGGVLLALLAALLWPATYRSIATIYVEPADVMSEGADVEDLPARQIARVTQRVMTTETLSELIRNTGLYADRSDLSVIERVELLEQNYSLEQVVAESLDSRGRPTESVVTFSIAFDDADPAMAQRVVSGLVTEYLDQSEEIRKSRIEERVRFLGDEARQIGREIQGLEQERAEFQAQNQGALPGSYQSSVQLLQRAEAARQETDRRLAAIEDRMIYLRAELSTINGQLSSRSAQPVMPREQLLAAEAELRVLGSRYGENHPDVVSKQRQIDALRSAIEAGKLAAASPELMTARVELATARERYTENHPEVVRLTQEVAELEASEDGSGGAYSEAEVRLRADLASAEAEARSLATIREEQTRQIAALEAGISRLPEVELDYSEITRDLDNLREQYLNIKAQELDARVALEVERQRRGQRFLPIEGPTLPEQPHSPNRGAILFFGFVLSLFLSVLLVALLETLDTRVYGRRALIDVFGAPPLAAIPVIGPTPHAGGAQVNRNTLYAATGVVIAGLIALLLVHLFVVELPVLFGRLLGGLG